MGTNELIFWFHAPPKVEKGAFNHVSRVWDGKVIYLCVRDLNEERKNIAWNDDDFGNAELIILSKYSDPKLKVKEILRSYPNAIHIMAGFASPIKKYIKEYLKMDDPKLLVYTEKPKVDKEGIYGILQLLVIPFKYKFYKIKYNKYVKALLPLGVDGVNTYKKLGWESEIMFPFMYCPQHNYEVIKTKKTSSIDLKMLYIGRFNYVTRGLDTLMDSINFLPETGWQLDLVGGYGSRAEEVIKWAERQKNVNFIGTWAANTVSKNMSDYDIVVVPSKRDGWNLITNEAINSGIGIIVSNKAVSHELVQSSSSGIVIKANSAYELSRAIIKAIEDPALVSEWKNNAILFSPRISPESVGNYFIDIINYTFCKKKSKYPVCPWLGE